MEQFPEFKKYSIVKKTNETITSYNTLTTNYFDNQKIKNMNDKKTAVKWLIKELEEQKLIKLDKLSTILFNKNFATRYELIIEQAKQMEKEQIKQAWENGALPDLLKEYKNSRTYFEQTFKK